MSKTIHSEINKQTCYPSHHNKWNEKGTQKDPPLPWITTHSAPTPPDTDTGSFWVLRCAYKGPAGRWLNDSYWYIGRGKEINLDSGWQVVEAYFWRNYISLAICGYSRAMAECLSDRWLCHIQDEWFGEDEQHLRSSFSWVFFCLTFMDQRRT